MKKCIVFTLLVSISCAVISACAKDTADTGTESGTDTQPQIVSEETIDPSLYQSELPEADYDGYTFTFLKYYYAGSLWEPRDLWCETADGDLINDAVYKRNLAVSEKFNVEFEEIASDNYTGLLTKANKSGDDAYGSVQLFLQHVPSILLGKNLLNVSNLPYLNFDKKYWDLHVIEPLTIGGECYLFNGDINISENDASGILMLNKIVAADSNVENLYELVTNGTWTVDKFSGLIKGISSDVDGDGEMTYKDKWGFICQYDSMSSFLTGMGGSFAQKDENDLPVLSFYNDKNISASEKLFAVMYDAQNSFNIQKLTGVSGDVKNYADAMFNENRALFYWVRMRQLEDYRVMDTDFGLLPMPKYDEAQQNYITEINVFIGTTIAVPTVANDPERTSVILEALAEQSHIYLTPAYYDLQLGSKLTRDEDSVKMLDIILSNENIDIGEVYAFGTLANSFVLMATNNDTNVSSMYEKLREKTETDIANMIDAFKDSDGN